jgi:HEAT repeat protein
MWAANSLMLMRDKSVIPDLEPLLNDDRPEVARTAKEAISKLQQKETAPKDH